MARGNAAPAMQNYCGPRFVALCVNSSRSALRPKLSQQVTVLGYEFHTYNFGAGDSTELTRDKKDQYIG